MQYRGITFDIKVTIERGEWVWVVHTPKPREGKFTGTRDAATRHAKNAIDTWCLRNPQHSGREITVG